MTVDMGKAVLGLKLLFEGFSLRGIERITELHRDTIIKLLVSAGVKCARIMARRVCNVTVNDVECDEIWGLGMGLTQVGMVSQRLVWLVYWCFCHACSSGTRASRAGQGARPTSAAVVIS